MATPTEIKTLFTYALDASPAFEPRSAEPERPWIRRFSEQEDVPAAVVQAAIDLHINRSKFFPSVAELVSLLRDAQSHALESTAQEDAKIWQRIQSFRARQKALEDTFFYEGEFDPNDFERLAQQMIAADHPHQAEACRRKAATLAQFSRHLAHQTLSEVRS